MDRSQDGGLLSHDLQCSDRPAQVLRQSHGPSVRPYGLRAGSNGFVDTEAIHARADRQRSSLVPGCHSELTVEPGSLTPKGDSIRDHRQRLTVRSNRGGRERLWVLLNCKVFDYQALEPRPDGQDLLDLCGGWRAKLDSHLRDLLEHALCDEEGQALADRGAAAAKLPSNLVLRGRNARLDLASDREVDDFVSYPLSVRCRMRLTHATPPQC